jgi:tRNA pseudouridine55 synthase
MDGILNIHKLIGMTSFDVVAKVRRLTGIKKVGHAGTLDPDASGVLPVCVGKATKVIEFLMEKDKAYRVGLSLGKATDTQDASGKTLYEKKVSSSNEEIEKAIKGFVGTIEQIPPMYSAIRIDGKRLYDLARQGIEVERKPRTVTMFKIDILGIQRIDETVSVTMNVECSKGTYMRTLCHDIGEVLECGGHMSSLERTRSGPFLLESSYTLENLFSLKDEGKLETAFLSMDHAITHFPSVSVSQSEARKLMNGLTVMIKDLTPGFSRVYHENGCFLAIGETLEQDNNYQLKAYKWIGHESASL